MNSVAFPHKQSGAILLTFVLVLVAGTSYLLFNKLNATAIRNAQDEHDARVLAEAKQALIAYAVTFQETVGSSPPNLGRYGFLPCPDTDVNAITEGGAHGTCGSMYVNSLGRLPWRTLGLDPLKDSSGECLWYAVSGQYKHSSTSSPRMLNADTNGTFEIYTSDGTQIAGANPEDRPVAVIIAPGAVVRSQNRERLDIGTEICGGNYLPSNYLDAQNPDDSGIQNHTLSNNADQIDQFIIGSASKEHLNDKIVYVTKKDIWEGVKARNDFAGKLYDPSNVDNLTKSVAECIASYGLSHGGLNYSLPWPTAVISPDYRDSNNYNDMSASDNLLSGRVPDRISNSNNAIGISTPARLITECFSSDAELLALWENWKDHLFYAVADSYQPRSTPSPACNQGELCITINNNFPSNAQRDYAGVVIFSGYPINIQSRNAPPIDSDDKAILSNYLEERDPQDGNDINNYMPYTSGTKRYDYQNTSETFNDVLYCINDDDGNPVTTLEVTECPTTP